MSSRSSLMFLSVNGTAQSYGVIPESLREAVARFKGLASSHRTPRRVRTSAEDQEVEPVASCFRIPRVCGISYRAAETFFAAEELVVREPAQRRVGAAEGVELTEE